MVPDEALAEVSLLIQDRSVVIPGKGTTEIKHLKLPDARTDRFMDGPATRRIAVVDFDPATGSPLGSLVPFQPYKPATPTRGRYRSPGTGGVVGPDGVDDSPSTLAINAFGTVFQTIRMFEAPGALGRQVQWAFGSDQLLIVPRAGQWANAFYDRRTRSLQFFWFDSDQGRIHTALSRDIVAHECGHALLDAVVPSLFDSLTPQSLAIHESVADLIAVLMALQSDALRRQVLIAGGFSIEGTNPFSMIAEQFGLARPAAEAGRGHALRELNNTDTLQTISNHEPHRLSTVLSAVFYDTLASIFEAQRARIVSAAELAHLSEEAVANRALGGAQQIFARLLLRAIDYLPPGELSFADVGRAALAADLATDVEPPDADLRSARRALVRRFRDRRIISRFAELASPDPGPLDVPVAEVPELHESDWAAYRFVEQHRDTLGIPAGVPFTVLPRVDATKRVPRRGAEPVLQRELLLKVAWSVVEPNSITSLGARHRRVPTGATVALRWDDGVALALVRSDATSDGHRRARDAMVRSLLARRLLVPEGSQFDGGASWRVSDGVAEFVNTQTLLHMAGDVV